MNIIKIDNFLVMDKLKNEAKKYGFDIKLNSDSVMFKYNRNNQILVVDRISNIDIMNGIDPSKTVRVYDYNFNLTGYYKFIEYWNDGDLLTKYIIEICFPTLMGFTNFQFKKKEMQVERFVKVLDDLNVNYVINKQKKYRDNVYICSYKSQNNSNNYVEKGECISLDFYLFNKFWGIILNDGFFFVQYSDNSCYEIVFKLPLEYFCGVMAQDDNFIETAVRGFINYINENWNV